MDAVEKGRPDPTRDIRMVVFDVEGVILPTQRYLLEEMTLLARWNQLSVLLGGLLYVTGIRRLKPTLERIYHHFKGVPFEDFTDSFEKTQLIPGVAEVIDRLREKGILVAMISSGVPEVFLQRLARKLDIDVDCAVGPDLEVVEGRLTGRIFGDVIEADGKKTALTRLLKEASIPPSACAVVADDRNNLPMFRLKVLRIGFNPDFALATHSDLVVRGELSEILPILLGDHQEVKSNLGQSHLYVRETIHMGSFLLPFVCQFLALNRFLLSILILLTALGYILGEAYRFRGRSLPPFTTVTRWAATGSERWDFATAPLFLAAGVILSLSVFPPPSGYVGITVVTLGDGVAKIAGRRWGRIVIPFNRSKTVEGTLAGFAASALVASLYARPMSALFAAGAGMVAEALPTPVNDNLLIPVVVGLVALVPV